MRKNQLIYALSAAALVCSATASAGSFEIWTDSGSKGGNTTMIVSFTGDGKTEDAQVDIDVPAGMKFLRADVKVAGSVCVALPGQTKVRVVPPSGAGTALSSSAVDYCSFSFKGKPANAHAFRPSFTECAAPGSTQTCGAEATDVSAK